MGFARPHRIMQITRAALWSARLSSLGLFSSISMRLNFRPVSANRHAAPSPAAAASMVSEQLRAVLSLAHLHVREVFLAHKFRQCFADRVKQRIRGALASARA